MAPDVPVALNPMSSPMEAMLTRGKEKQNTESASHKICPTSKEIMSVLKKQTTQKAFGVNQAVYLRIHNVFADKDLTWKLSFVEIKTNFPVNNYRYSKTVS